MQVVLLADVKGIGSKGSVVEVKQGYANNFLFKKNLAVEATAKNLNNVKTQEKARLAKEAQKLADAQALAKELKDKTFTMQLKVGDNGKLFGKVTTMDLAKSLVAHGYEIDKRQIQFPEDIKSLGIFEANLKLHQQVSTVVKVEVIAE